MPRSTNLAAVTMRAAGNVPVDTELFTYGFDYAGGVLKLYDFKEYRVEVWTKQPNGVTGQSNAAWRS